MSDIADPLALEVTGFDEHGVMVGHVCFCASGGWFVRIRRLNCGGLGAKSQQDAEQVLRIHGAVRFQRGDGKK